MRISDWSSDVCSSDLAAAKAAASAAAAAQVAYGGTMDGAEIFNNLCTGCHTSGVGNAPTMDKSHWAARITQGTETQAGGILDEGALVDRAEQAAALQVGCHHRHDVGAELLFLLHLAVELGQRDRQRLHEALVDIDVEIGRASCRERVCQYV